MVIARLQLSSGVRPTNGISLRHAYLILGLLFGCRANDGGNRLVAADGLELDTSATVLPVQPPFVLGTGTSALCLQLDSSSHVVELPHIILRRRAPEDGTHTVLAMDRRSEGAVAITGRFEGAGGQRTAGAPTQYVSSHALCFGNLPDSTERVYLSSSEAIRVTRVEFKTTYK
jgi:hypothetical protein